jgi:hypothetical protein
MGQGQAIMEIHRLLANPVKPYTEKTAILADGGYWISFPGKTGRIMCPIISRSPFSSQYADFRW